MFKATNEAGVEEPITPLPKAVQHENLLPLNIEYNLYLFDPTPLPAAQGEYETENSAQTGNQIPPAPNMAEHSNLLTAGNTSASNSSSGYTNVIPPVTQPNTQNNTRPQGGSILDLIVQDSAANTQGNAANPANNTSPLAINTAGQATQAYSATSPANEPAVISIEVAEWLKKSPLWLAIKITPNLDNGYYYAPFALEQNNSQINQNNTAVLPTSFELTNVQTEVIPNIAFYYPPGKLKADIFSGLELAVYNEQATFYASFPASLIGQELQLKVSALICTPSSCTPFRKNFNINLTAADIKPFAQLHKNDGTLASYRATPYLNLQDDIIESAGTSKEAATPHTNAQPQEQQIFGDFAEYLTAVTPAFYQNKLEVGSIGAAILLGFAAGLILNFMPCVLPVISLKIGTLLGLGGWSGIKGKSNAALKARKRFRLYAACFSLGIFVWFALLFGAIGFAGIMWGQFFQNQTLILALTLLLFVMALALFGMVKLPVLHAEINKNTSLPLQAFFGGLLATLLATPCSGPLLGGVLGWAVTQSLPNLGITLASVATGMASPFLLMALKPSIAERLPKPGPWNKKLEIVMGFVLLGTVIYLLSMLPAHKQIATISACLILAFCAWLWGQGKKEFGVLKLAAIVIAFSALYMPFIYQLPTTGWKNFTPQELSKQLGKQNLLIDFTADWCINCRAMELTTLTEQKMAAWANAYNLNYIKVDLTGTNPNGEALLSAFGSASIPLLAIIPTNSPQNPLILRDLVTAAQLDAALKQALK
ncbi:hypothetical protein LJB93_01830 [Desulfovibrio sp. OttesenSCG-928-F07]|nr:hypothetical protein [Desulfovibrio sp. OttesenSCG-928-F07]